MKAFNTVAATVSEDTSTGLYVRSMVNALADHIRSLGYVVECGYDLDYYYGWRKHSYVIIGIQNKEGDYVYGRPEPPTEWQHLVLGTCKWSEAELDEHWPLLRSHKIGSRYRVNIKGDELDTLLLSGELRTFGNTLPEDIVQVLKGYQGSETLSRWEFEIPQPTVCHCADMGAGAKFEDGVEMEAVAGVATQDTSNSSIDD